MAGDQLLSTQTFAVDAAGQRTLVFEQKVLLDKVTPEVVLLDDGRAHS